MKIDDTYIQWENPESFETLTYPVSREGHSLYYSQKKNVLIMFGGMSSTKNNELYFYDLKKNSWEEVKTKGIHPQPRCYH